MGSHDKCYLVSNGDDGNKYYTYCKKYEDSCETSFKAKVKENSGYPCRTVRRENSEPSSGIDLSCC